MKKRLLGNTGIAVSEIAFGGVEIGMPYGIGVAGKEDMLSEKEAILLLHEAQDRGINFFDTARLYGESESIIGKAFEGRRNDIVLATKCSHFRKDGKLPPDWELRPFIEHSLQQSLEMLKTDYLDVFMLHQADVEILQNETIAEVFSELKEKGIIRATGASTYATEETSLAIGSGRWDVIQLPFNLMDQRHGSFFQKASENGVGLVIRSVLMKGLLSDRGKNLHPALADVERHIQSYHTWTGDRFPDLPTLATRFALSFEEVSSVLVGIDKTAYLEKALATANGSYMHAAMRKEAENLVYPDPEFLNLPHWDRMGWLK
ncbi:aryl-alcohol dehydrogenase-like predicted oxidoreductase [Dyadobacter sp. BE34]|uniref:Aryl-alcohol dehydrogenase-like predicted oxidoreductase n=1 Tax=Dyadobacter fermentans TaxID=94254 RepID=A0ABU1QUU6_9BACT|nr:MULTISPECIES: aldo/keto reductase [Dyadobacter]MDR6804530.1 aryl-alcohol dehydrogenase-like predicted oxidoreductase [Dyadobacter fermentans]MDR7042270.1 aryl-alcohol dehydrogenase-like predicted oxidoreductase [Dyadobacter sp. BE242]MDR7196673.1 aryl-alcohol dehydrogenase-like predicted oxidoreductase [Dyadobacter sp. BE34]MDR7212782.1 aryl-alcohol dehydrogenase-like predicted oxidoreductase [Dyadobacter sp. BE31]MDR7262079.1 aryl-alcohol dehydrogenase-like predicted oxidoreductase [Dyadob